MNDMIGKTIWIFDENHREYQDDYGNRTQAPNYRKQWRPRKIVGETSGSWILDGAFKTKLSKKPEKHHNVIFDAQTLEDEIYKHDNAYKIAELVRKADASTLREIAKLINYK